MARERDQQSRARLGPDSYRRSDGIARRRLVTSIGMPLMVLVLFVIAPAWNRNPALSRWGRFASPGPLMRSHAVWESQCEVCHLPFTSVDRSKVSDQKCQACHDGPPHHASQLTTGVPPCGSCHSDHSGREISLVRIDDSACIQCHVALTSFRKGDAGPLTIAASVTRFDGNPVHHPEFRWLNRALMGDPG
jgi:predicted CXXCH cytochrome family protein